ncbi:MAG TPA: four helix bundle protein [Bacteroidales bacterium]|jgi:four helix bundle protein|nr:four helix bundle protein [Bacteroidales bacterium]
MKLEEFKVYQLSMEIAEKIWVIVDSWGYFAKDTVGKQLVRAIDSVAANLSEGYGRYHYRESIHFSYYSRGSLFETKTWLTKARNRKLLKTNDYLLFSQQIDDIGIRLNNYIKSIGKINNYKDNGPANDN